MALLEKGAEVNAKDGFGNTPLIYAAIENNTAAIKKLLDAQDIEVNRKK